jgi:hypothetical protein
VAVSQDRARFLGNLVAGTRVVMKNLGSAASFIVLGFVYRFDRSLCFRVVAREVVVAPRAVVAAPAAVLSHTSHLVCFLVCAHAESLQDRDCYHQFCRLIAHMTTNFLLTGMLFVPLSLSNRGLLCMPVPCAFPRSPQRLLPWSQFALISMFGAFRVQSCSERMASSTG